MHLPRMDGLIQLERTGPYIPPLTQPGLDVVVTDALRIRLQGSGLTGPAFQPVIKRHIARLAWEHWDRSAGEPPEYPESGEPEDYILARPHDEQAAHEVGTLYEMLAPPIARVERTGRFPNESILLVADSARGMDIFRAEGVGFVYVSERARAWLTDAAGEWLDLTPVATT